MCAKRTLMESSVYLSTQTEGIEGFTAKDRKSYC